MRTQEHQTGLHKTYISLTIKGGDYVQSGQTILSTVQVTSWFSRCKVANMSLAKISSGQYLDFVSFFNSVCVDDVIGVRELRAILERAGRDPTDEEVMQIISSVSTDSRGITFQAFMGSVSSFQNLRDMDSEYREAFRIYDKSGEGRLTQADVEDAMRRLCIKMDVPKLFSVADTDNNGFIDYSEFVELMKTKF